MSKARIGRREQEELDERQAQRRLAVQLRIVLAFAALAGVIAGIAAGWERLFPVAPERQVTVYWTHSCRCVASWIHALEAEGFRVRDFEMETLDPIRRTLGTPAALRGCHVAAFLDYFIEGHVRADSLRRLALERPPGRGVALAANVLRHSYRPSAEQGSAVLLYDGQGSPRVWSSAQPEPETASLPDGQRRD